MKKIQISFIVVFLLLFLCGCNNTADFDKVSAYVNKNYEKLEKIVGYEEENYQNNSFVRENLGLMTIVKSVYRYDENIVEFSCGGTGLSTNSTYTGFYYSATNEPNALEFEPCTFSEIEQNVFEWKNEDGTHQFKTQRIRENWFYYYMVYH